VQAITWWDFQDAGWMGAPGGLLRADLTPKPAYDRLLDLVKRQWWTRVELATDAQGAASFRGFLGRYRVTVEGRKASPASFDLRPGDSAVTVRVGEPLAARPEGREVVREMRWRPEWVEGGPSTGPCAPTLSGPGWRPEGRSHSGRPHEATAGPSRADSRGGKEGA
jgi:hypothetical protein